MYLVGSGFSRVQEQPGEKIGNRSLREKAPYRTPEARAEHVLGVGFEPQEHKTRDDITDSKRGQAVFIL